MRITGVRRMNETDNLLMLMMGAYKRRVGKHWIVPSKGKPWKDWMTPDESPEGLYPSMIVVQDDYDKVMVLMPETEFDKLLDAWKLIHKKEYRAANRITQEERQKKALRGLRRLFEEKDPFYGSADLHNIIPNGAFV